MKKNQFLTASFAIALGIAILWFVKMRQASMTSLDEPNPQLKSAAEKDAESAKAGSQNPRLNEFPVNDSFEFPLLGRVRAHSRIESVTYSSANGVQTPFPLKVYYTSNGVFVRAEYFRPGAEDHELPLFEAEKNYRSSGEKIYSVPEQAASANLQSILDNLHGQYGGQFEQSTKFNITYVLWEQYDQSPKPVFIINMFGTGKSVPKSPDKPTSLRIRFVFDADGNIMFFDNVI